MNKKFSKTILSSAVAGLLLVSVNSFAQELVIGDKYKIIVDENTQSAKIVGVKDAASIFDGVINIATGTVTTVNKTEVEKAINDFYQAHPKIKAQADKNPQIMQMVVQQAGEAARYSASLPPEIPSITSDNLQNITIDDIENIKKNIDAVSKVITSKTAADYNQAVKNGMSSEAALTVAKDGGAVLKEFNRIDSDIDQLNKETTFALDADGNITLDENQGSGERYSVKQTVADIKADTTVYQNKDGSYTLDQSAPGNVRVNDAVVSLDNRTRSNTQAIQNHSRQLQEHNAR
ncbi:hypothetical protein NZI56_005237, partial [Escherichia coli]|nr:hypothetical protein [Escherichia coli]